MIHINVRVLLKPKVNLRGKILSFACTLLYVLCFAVTTLSRRSDGYSSGSMYPTYVVGRFGEKLTSAGSTWPFCPLVAVMAAAVSLSLQIVFIFYFLFELAQYYCLRLVGGAFCIEFGA